MSFTSTRMRIASAMTCSSFRFPIWVCLLWLTLASLPARAAEIDFRRQIQPILAEHCTMCHGADEASRQGGLRLDIAEAAYQGGDSGEPAIAPQNPAASLIIHRVTSTDPDEMMPPPSSNHTISPAEVELLKKWIEQGAEYQQHWAFEPPKKSPRTPSDVNPIDALVTAKLNARGLELSPPAPAHTLVRRLYLDTIGIPPTPAEVDAFDPAQIESTIDKLLASESFGEKWARHWLDAARYSDTNGYEKDMRREQWAWRDWVIQALNRDMPYDQFVIQQIAGDLLPNATQDEIVATGFLRNSMLNEEGAIVPEQFRMVEMFDRLDCVGKAVMGLTTQCVQCHNHKFDPITQEEYFGLFAYLNNCYEAQSGVYNAEQLKTIASIQQSVREVESRIQQERPNWRSEMETWESQVRQSNADWQVIEFDDLNSVSGLNHPAPQTDGSILMTGHTSGEVYMIGSPDLQGATGFRLEILTHGDLPFQGPGRSAKGMWQIHSIDLLVQKPGGSDWEKIKPNVATSDFSTVESKSGDGKKSYGPVSHLIDDDGNTFWTSDRGPGRRNQASVAVLAWDKPLDYPEGSRFKVALHMEDNVGCCRMSLTKSPAPKAPACDHVGVLAMLKQPAMRTEADRAVLFRGWRLNQAELQQANTEIQSHLDRYPDPYTTVLHLAEREETAARPTHLLDRGEWDQPAQPVQPHVPKVLHPLPDGQGEPPRLAFARWLVDRRSPLAARVVVNRAWQAIFGVGLVETAEDFGTRTAIPEQADVLDQLAVEFMENGWSQKQLIKRILMSRVYQQSSAYRKDLADIDPNNRFLARGPRMRAEAEVVRDIVLASAGLLTQKIGGPSVIPPVPKNVLEYNYVVPTYWTPATGPERYRRALYVFRKRSMPDPVLSSLDAPNGDFACARRVRSNTPLAALAGLNEPIFVEAAQAMALRVLKESEPNDNARIDHAFRLCTSRTATIAEHQAIEGLLKEQRDRLAQGWLNPREVATGDPNSLPNLPDGATPVDAAAWTIVSRVILNLDETISKN